MPQPTGLQGRLERAGAGLRLVHFSFVPLVLRLSTQQVENRPIFGRKGQYLGLRLSTHAQNGK
jgi:hypothetical protein